MWKREEKLIIIPNHSKQTFTLKFVLDNKCMSKYRTSRFIKDVFDEMLYMSNYDWKIWLSITDFYTKIK